MQITFGFLSTTYMCAGLAYLIARVIYDFGSRLKEAREIGSYRLVARLGHGGMGDVWIAKHGMLARHAAIKLIRPEALGAEQADHRGVLQRFEREAQATAALRSNHTIDLYDFGVAEDGRFFYAMELLDGLDLESLVERFGPVSAGRAVFLLRQACHSLDEAHAAGMVHRDIKPANIYVCRLGRDFDFVKVLDFGLVKSMELKTGATQLTRDGATLGTPTFMAPETAMADVDVDGRSDIYALGCVAYWLLTGQLVFEGSGAVAMLFQHVQKEPVPPSERTEIEIPAALEEIILACLEKDPSDRPQSATELDTMLAAVAPSDTWDRDEAEAWWRLNVPESIARDVDEWGEGSGPEEALSVKR